MESLAQQGLTAGQQQAAMALLKQRAEQKRVEDEESLQASIASGQKRRGRPPGSRNRPREDGMKHSYWWFHSFQLSSNLQAHLQYIGTGSWQTRAGGAKAVLSKMCDLEGIKHCTVSSFLHGLLCNSIANAGAVGVLVYFCQSMSCCLRMQVTLMIQQARSSEGVPRAARTGKVGIAKIFSSP